MDSKDETTRINTVPINATVPIMTQLAGDESPKGAVPIPPWLRRFASVVGLAGAGVSSGNPAMFS